MWDGFITKTLRLTLLLWLLLSGRLLASSLEVTFLDAGEGDAIYIRTPGGENLLVDTANPATAVNIVRFLRSRGVNTLHAVFITHPHPDHMGGIFQILSTFSVERIYDNGQPVESMPRCDIYRWYVESVRRLSAYRILRAGQTLEYGKVRVEVLWPRELKNTGWNENSLILRISYAGRVFLLMGDAGSRVEEVLIRDRPHSVRADVLKAGHHGSEGTLSEGFLRRVSPAYVVISVNRDNLRGYPSKVVLERLDEMGIKTLITYRDGNTGFIVHRDGTVRVVTQR